MHGVSGYVYFGSFWIVLTVPAQISRKAYRDSGGTSKSSLAISTFAGFKNSRGTMPGRSTTGGSATRLGVVLGPASRLAYVHGAFPRPSKGLA